MAVIQLDFFEETDLSIIKARMDKVEDSANKCRKKQFAEIGAMKKEIAELKETVDLLVRNICKSKLSENSLQF